MGALKPLRFQAASQPQSSDEDFGLEDLSAASTLIEPSEFTFEQRSLTNKSYHSSRRILLSVTRLRSRCTTLSRSPVDESSCALMVDTFKRYIQAIHSAGTLQSAPELWWPVHAQNVGEGRMHKCLERNERHLQRTKGRTETPSEEQLRVQPFEGSFFTESCIIGTICCFLLVRRGSNAPAHPFSRFY